MGNFRWSLQIKVQHSQWGQCTYNSLTHCTYLYNSLAPYQPIVGMFSVENQRECNKDSGVEEEQMDVAKWCLAPWIEQVYA